MKPVNEVKLSFACGENWNDFKPVAGGRLCEKCKHIVHDFTNTTPEEMAEVLKANPGRICGRFRTSPPKSSFMKRAAVVTATLALGACWPDINPNKPEENRPIEEVPVEMETELYITTGIIFVPDSVIEAIEPDLANNNVHKD
jgi:hypothetical protein